MKKILYVLPFLFLLLTAAIPPQPTEVAPTSPSLPNNYQNAKLALETVKGKKLNVKEKIALKAVTSKAFNKKQEGSGKSQLIALILCFFLGLLGIHRFYLGYTTAGVIQLLTGGGFGIWTLIDLIRIVTGDLKPKGGKYSKTLSDY